MAEASQDNPDLTNGVPEGDLADSAMLVGQIGDEAVLLARRGHEIFAIGATFRSSGASITTCRSIMSAAPRPGARLVRTAIRMPMTQRGASVGPAAP